MREYVTVFVEPTLMARGAVAAWGGGLLIAGTAALWLLRNQAWGVGQFLAAVPALLGGFLLFSLLLPQAQVTVTEGIVSSYARRGGARCFTVQGEVVCAIAAVPLRDGQWVRVTRAGTAPIRIEVAREFLMTDAVVAEREREYRRADEPVDRRVYRAGLVVAVGLFGWLTLFWKRVLSPGVPPPHGVLSRVVFRMFIGLQAISACLGLANELRAHPLTRDEALPSLAVTAAMGFVVFFIFRYCFREFERRRIFR